MRVSATGGRVAGFCDLEGFPNNLAFCFGRATLHLMHNPFNSHARLAGMARALLSPLIGKPCRVYQTCGMGYDKRTPQTGVIRAIQRVKVVGSDRLWTSCLIMFEDGTSDNRIYEDFCHIGDDGVYEWRV